MAKVALLSLYNYPSMPVRQLHGVLAAHPVHEPVSVFFKRHRLDRMAPPTETEYRLLLDLLDELQPAYVGLSLRSTFAIVAHEIAQRLRRAGHLVVWGGTHATVAPEDCIDDGDAVCIGEGEGAIIDLADRLDAGNRDFSGIPNLWARDRDGQVVQAPSRPLVADLDTLARPWYDDGGCYYIEHDETANDLPVGFMTSYDLMTSRGCPYRCQFCIHSKLVDEYRGLGNYMRRRSPESVIQELEWAVGRYPSVNRIRFWDDVFPAARRGWLEEFAELYRRRVGLPFWCYTYPSLSDPKTIATLRHAGMRYLGMGIQSGSYRVRSEVFRRPGKNDEIIEASKNIAAGGVHAELDIISDNPFEIEEDFQQTLEVLLQLSHPFSLFQHSLAHFPNYPLTERAIEAGYITPDDVEHKTGKGFRQWHDEFSHNRKPEHLFWITIFYLTQFPVVPDRMIRMLSTSPYWRAHPKALNRMVRPFGRLAERFRRLTLYLRERGAAHGVRRLLQKFNQIVRHDSGGARAVWGAD